MSLNVCTMSIFLTFIWRTCGYFDHDYSPNVGTVLFNRNDKYKSHWTKTEISLLRARRYFQSILPPPGFVNFSEDYVNILLNYFRDSYSNIKRAASDPEIDAIMTTALSDVLGGYLKVWVLPVAKLDYYGGTISQDHVNKLFEFYNEIRMYLDTDGDGWRTLDDNLLNSITINIAPKRLTSNTRSMKDPCEDLAYFEKTPQGLSIPLPGVSWISKPGTMFVPLKNMTLIPMNAPQAANMLLKYYDTAMNCIAANNPKGSQTFEERFQTWLSNDIIPHLKDEHLYLALGSVLTLANRTRNLNHVMNLNDHKTCKPKQHIEITSKKMIIIIVILLIEIAWCVPALIYILCSKKKKDSTSNVYLYIDQPQEEKRSRFSYFRRPKQTKSVKLDPRPETIKNLRDIETQRPTSPPGHCGTITSEGLLSIPQTCYTEFQAQFPSSQFTIAAGTGSQIYYAAKNQSADAIVIPDTKKPSHKKIDLDEVISRTMHNAPVLESQDEFIYSDVQLDLLGYVARKGSPKKPATKSSNHPKSGKPCTPPKKNKKKVEATSCECDQFPAFISCECKTNPKPNKKGKKADKNVCSGEKKGRHAPSYDNLQRSISENLDTPGCRKTSVIRKQSSESILKRPCSGKKPREYRHTKSGDCSKSKHRDGGKPKPPECNKQKPCDKTKPPGTRRRKSPDSGRRKSPRSGRKNTPECSRECPNKNEPESNRRKSPECKRECPNRQPLECPDECPNKKPPECGPECSKKTELDRHKKQVEYINRNPKPQPKTCPGMDSPGPERRKPSVCETSLLSGHCGPNPSDSSASVIPTKCLTAKTSACDFKATPPCCTTTLPDNCHRQLSFEDISENSKSSSTTTTTTSSSSDSRRKSTESEINAVNYNQPCLSPADMCPCTACVTTAKDNTQHERTEDTPSAPNEPSLYGEIMMLNQPCCTQRQQVEPISTQPQTFNEYKTKFKKGSFKVNNSGNSYFEIIIERPAVAEISVGVSGKVDLVQNIEQGKQQRKSKIPKLNAGGLQAIMSRALGVRQNKSPAPLETRKSMIPQLKKKTFDDMVLTHCTCKPNAETRLNDTL